MYLLWQVSGTWNTEVASSGDWTEWGSFTVWQQIGPTCSWIDHQKRTDKKSIYRKTERTTTDPQLRVKSSRRGASTGAGTQAPCYCFGKLSLKNRWKNPNKLGSTHHWMRLAKSSNPEVSGVSEMPQSCDKWIFRKPNCCVSAQKMCWLIAQLLNSIVSDNDRFWNQNCQNHQKWQNELILRFFKQI